MSQQPYPFTDITHTDAWRDDPEDLDAMCKAPLVAGISYQLFKH